MLDKGTINKSSKDHSSSGYTREELSELLALVTAPISRELDCKEYTSRPALLEALATYRHCGSEVIRVSRSQQKLLLQFTQPTGNYHGSLLDNAQQVSGTHSLAVDVGHALLKATELTLKEAERELMLPRKSIQSFCRELKVMLAKEREVFAKLLNTVSEISGRLLQFIQFLTDHAKHITVVTNGFESDSLTVRRGLKLNVRHISMVSTKLEDTLALVESIDRIRTNLAQR